MTTRERRDALQAAYKQGPREVGVHALSNAVSGRALYLVDDRPRQPRDAIPRPPGSGSGRRP